MVRNSVERSIVWAAVAIAVFVIAAQSGCSSSQYLAKRKQPFNPLAVPLNLLSRKGPEATSRTKQTLRRYNLNEDDNAASASVLARFEEEISREPTPDKIHAFAELAYVRGKKLDDGGRNGDALDMYGAAVAHAYYYLFDEGFDNSRNPYDPQFRSACDIYNAALESALRLAHRQGKLRPGVTQRIKTKKQEYVINISVQGRWPAEEFERLEFVSDYDLEKFNNRHRTYGLGVPLIAVRKPKTNQEAVEQYYPNGLSFPVTAFLRVHRNPLTDKVVPGEVRQCTLELHDPIVARNIHVEQRLVPLETDLTTPLAYFLDTPEFEQRKNIATLGLLNPAGTKELDGLYMLEPYDPNKIPVLMVHGLWSSPLTWMDMFNDLRSFPEIRDRYQFWFYLYPTGQPFWVSATRLRKDLDRVRDTIDVQRQLPALDQMVLVGHSMGGLVSRLQTLDSGDDFWKILSDKPFDQLEASQEDREQLANILFFQPNESIRRVITMGTPHRGSEFANSYTRWLGRKLIRLPSFVTNVSNRIIRENPGLFRNTELLTISTSIDSLAPESPILPVMLRAQKAPWVRYHNVVGHLPKAGFVERFKYDGDGVVQLASAQLEDIESEIEVPADHMGVHRHPKAILEVRRILLEHARDIDRQWAREEGGRIIAKAPPRSTPHQSSAQPAGLFRIPHPPIPTIAP